MKYAIETFKVGESEPMLGRQTISLQVSKNVSTKQEMLGKYLICMMTLNMVIDIATATSRGNSKG